MCGARELLGTVVVFGNRTRRAKRRRLGVLNAKDKQQRRRVYRDLLKVTEETYRSAQRVAEQLEESGLTEPVKRASTERIAADFAHFLVLTKKVINQTQRRVIDEERVPAEEKDVSRGPWKKNGALHSVIRVSYQAATSACSRTSLRRW